MAEPAPNGRKLDIGPLRRQCDWVGVVVESLRQMTTNGGIAYPAGTEFVVLHTYKGLQLHVKPCAHCGISTGIQRVSKRDVIPLRRALPVPDGRSKWVDTTNAVEAAWPEAS